MIPIDEAALNWIDRLGVAYCRLSNWEWDEILGPKPENFDNLPRYNSKRSIWRKSKVKTKFDYIIAAQNEIREIIGDANVSRCWWVYGLGESEKEWLKWYFVDQIRKYLQ